jgi:hypothetical protein
MSTVTAASTSFTTKQINRSTFAIREADVYKEHPLIFVKVHPAVPLIILSDTGCDEPEEKHKHGMCGRSFAQRFLLIHLAGRR